MKDKPIWVVEILTTHEDMLSPYAWHIDHLDEVLKLNARLAVEHVDTPVDFRRSNLFGWMIVALARDGKEAHEKADKLKAMMVRNRNSKDFPKIDGIQI